SRQAGRTPGGNPGEPERRDLGDNAGLVRIKLGGLERALDRQWAGDAVQLECNTPSECARVEQQESRLGGCGPPLEPVGELFGPRLVGRETRSGLIAGDWVQARTLLRVLRALQLLDLRGLLVRRPGGTEAAVDGRERPGGVEPAAGTGLGG